MKKYWFLIILFILSFLQTTILPLNLLVIALSCWAFCRSLRELLIFAWLSGLLLDFLAGQPLGIGALFLLVFVTCLYFVRQKFIHTAYEPSLRIVAPLLSLSVFLAEICWQIFISFVTSSTITFSWINILTGIILALVFFPVISYFSLRWQETEQLELRF